MKTMPLPNPEVGLIVYYSYVFFVQTRTIGNAGKNRPCLIAAVFPEKENPANTGVLYLPISHTAPGPDDVAIEIPVDAKYAAGLDASQQWVFISQGNLDTWPEDLMHLPSQPGVFHFGYFPPSFQKSLQLAFARLYAERRFNMKPRNS